MHLCAFLYRMAAASQLRNVSQSPLDVWGIRVICDVYKQPQWLSTISASVLGNLQLRTPAQEGCDTSSLIGSAHQTSGIQEGTRCLLDFVSILQANTALDIH